MDAITEVLKAIDRGDPQAAEQLLPLVYEELRALAAQKLVQERPGQTLQATALVHEAYLRLVGSEAQNTKDEGQKQWGGRRHFFAAAAEAMRRILIERARHKKRLRHGGGRQRLDLDRLEVPDAEADEELLALDEALEHLAVEERQVAEVVKLRYFVGLTIEQAAEALGVSVRTANRHWAYAKAWLYKELSGREQ